MNKLLKQLIPFIVIGILITAFVFGIMLLAYLFVIGAIIGCILFLIRWIQSKFFSTKKIVKSERKSGRIIDSDDWKKL
jgi:hypothetical protein